MYYLVDTSRANGCLRVVPGSHLRRVPLHDELLEAHTEESYHSDPSSRMFRIQADEVDIAVKAGDLVIGDARVLHSAHGNTSLSHRPVITLWYAPDFDSLTEPVKVAMVGQSHELFPIPRTPRDIELIRDLLPSFEGSVEPAKWDRVPDRYLRRD
jgi:ectoine hydroxylase-related dioxygenase (phytanoyl-CoA dioxygenase family)